MAFASPAPADVVAWDERLLAKAAELYAGREWAPLAYLYQRAADLAWKGGHPRQACRLLLAERTLAAILGDQSRLLECTYFLAQRHRLQTSFTAAEFWNLTLLRAPLTADSAVMHVAALRELATISEVARQYRRGISACDRADEVADRFRDVPGMPAARVKTMLQRAVLLRLEGSYGAAAEVLRQAAGQAEAGGVDELTKGLVRLRDGGIQAVLGRAAPALAAYQAAAAHFAGVSEHNLLIAQRAQVAPLRALGKLDEALAITASLAERFVGDASPFRLGQVLLERAEVLTEKGDDEEALRTLERARPIFASADTLEALRWRTQLARALSRRGAAMTAAEAAQAVEYLAAVLGRGSEPGRGDVTRVMHALHALSVLPGAAAIPDELRIASCRAAVLAADLQRGALTEPVQRWSVHGEREEIYAAAVLLHAAVGDAAEAARITEAGRADLLNQLIAAGTGNWSGQLAGLPIVEAPAGEERAATLLTAARAIAAWLTDGMSAARPLPPEATVGLPVGDSLGAGSAADALADVIISSQLAHNGEEWRVTLAIRWRSADWQLAHAAAPAPAAALLDRLAAGRPLPERGISARTWEQLGALLLPDPRLWVPGGPGRARQVLICPDPRLWQLPYAALTRAGTPFVEVAEVTLTPSLRTALLLRERALGGAAAPSGRRRPAVTLLDPDLPGHDAEAEALAGWPGGQRAVAVLGDLADGAAHALLYVSGQGDVPGAATKLGPSVTLDELAGATLPSLVFLNGCWSGTAEGRFGQDPLSLAVGALIGGADMVVAGIGRIDSVSSAQVAARALGMIAGGAVASAALRLAQCEVRSAHPELTPFDWAGLHAVGWAPGR